MQYDIGYDNKNEKTDESYFGKSKHKLAMNYAGKSNS
jgi:hypothetical protein